MIRIEPKQKDFLELKSETIECKVPPSNTCIELMKMSYFESKDTYRMVHYKIECRIIALGVVMYHNSIGSTETKAYHIIETSNGYYYLLSLSEQYRYIVKVSDGTEKHNLV